MPSSRPVIAQRGTVGGFLLFGVAVTMGVLATWYVHTHRHPSAGSSIARPRMVAPAEGDLSEAAANRPAESAMLQVVAHARYDALLELVPFSDSTAPRLLLVRASKGAAVHLVPGRYEVVITYLQPGRSETVFSTTLPLLLGTNAAIPTLDLNAERVSRVPFRIPESGRTH